MLRVKRINLRKKNQLPWNAFAPSTLGFFPQSRTPSEAWGSLDVTEKIVSTFTSSLLEGPALRDFAFTVGASDARSAIWPMSMFLVLLWLLVLHITSQAFSLLQEASWSVLRTRQDSGMFPRKKRIRIVQLCETFTTYIYIYSPFLAFLGVI